MNAALTYTLPTIQLVCHLVLPDNSTINGTNPGAIQPPSTTPVPPLPEGYVAYPYFGAAYKVYNESVSWEVANERCIQAGAYLATIDSFAKIEAVNNQDTPTSTKHVGFHLIESETKWYNIHTGLSVAQTTLPWASGEPNGSGRCVLIRSTGGLGRYSCSGSMAKYVCERPYP